MSAETLWRCSSCGKWSHAKRRPQRHERSLGLHQPRDADVVSRTAEEREYETGSYEILTWVWCGPFVEYRAELVTS